MRIVAMILALILVAEGAIAVAVPPADERARGLLRRYLPEKADASPASQRSWIDANRERLFFSDVGGYRWRVNDRAAKSVQ